MSNKGYCSIEAPIGVGSLVYVDTATTISSMDPWLRSQRLSGIRTAKADGQATSLRFLQFDVDRACVVYLCWDMRMRKLPKWVSKWGFQASGLHLQTTVTTHVIFYRSYNANRRIVLGGCGMKVTAFENYIVLVGDALSSVIHTFDTKVYPGWRLRPSTELVARNRVRAETPKDGSTADLSPLESFESFNPSESTQVHSVYCFRFNLDAHSVRLTLLENSPLSPVVSFCAKSNIIDASCDVLDVSFRSLHREDAAQLYFASVPEVLAYHNGQPMYLVEPFTVTLYCNKVANDINLSVKGAVGDCVAINIQPEVVSKIAEYYHTCVSNGKCEAFPPSEVTPVLTRKFPSEGNAVLIYNSLGADVRMWITGAVFLETEKQLFPTPSAETDEENEYSQQTLVLAGTVAVVILQDPLIVGDPQSDDVLQGVSIDIAIDGWSDVTQVKLYRQGARLYPMALLEDAEYDIRGLAKPWRTLSDSSIQENVASPMVRWKSDPKLASVEMRNGRRDTIIDGTKDIFYAGFPEKRALIPFAIKVRCSLANGTYRDSGLLRVDLSTNINFKNLSGTPIKILCEECINADAPSKSLLERIGFSSDLGVNSGFDSQHILCGNGDSVTLPLPILRDLSIDFSPVGQEHLGTKSLPLRKELFDVNVPPALRRSTDTDLFGAVISDVIEDREEDADCAIWEIALPPCMTFVNATFCTITIQVMQPPKGKQSLLEL